MSRRMNCSQSGRHRLLRGVFRPGLITVLNFLHLILNLIREMLDFSTNEVSHFTCEGERKKEG